MFQITKGSSTSIEFIEELSALSGRPVQVCPMLQDPGHPADVFDCMDAYAAATSRGREIYGQVTPFPEIMDFNLREPYPLESLSISKLCTLRSPHGLVKSLDGFPMWQY